MKALGMTALTGIAVAAAAGPGNALPLGEIWHYNASAVGIQSNIRPLGLVAINIAPTPAVAVSDGTPSATATVVNVALPPTSPVVTANVLTVNASGATGFGEDAGARADSTVAGLGIALGPGLGAQAVSSECEADQEGARGSTTIVGGTGALSAVAVNPPPNTTIPLILFTIILNEQTTSDRQINGSWEHAIRVRAIVIRANAPGSGQIVVAESNCRVLGPTA